MKDSEIAGHEYARTYYHWHYTPRWRWILRWRRKREWKLWLHAMGDLIKKEANA